jgi:hypothetical protein
MPKLSENHLEDTMRCVHLAIVSMVGILALSGGALAQTTSAPAQPPQDDPDQIVCKETPPPTGTRLGAMRECHTKRDWDQRQKDSQSAAAHAEQMGLMGSPAGH